MYVMNQVMLRIIMCVVLCAFTFPAAANSRAIAQAFTYAQQKEWDSALASAHQSSNKAVLSLITWEYALDNESGASFEEIAKFIANHPNWPEQKKLRLRAEQSLRHSDVDDKDIIAWFGNSTPISGIGKITLAEALMRAQPGSPSTVDSLIKDGWIYGDFDEAQEISILNDHSGILKQDDHIKRTDRLLWDNSLSAAKRMLKQVPSNHKKLFEARIALIDNKRFAIMAISQVPSSLKRDPGLIFNRMVYRDRHDDNVGVRDMLLAAPASPPYPEKWWKYREEQIRKAIDEQHSSMAAKLLTNHGQTEGANLADATWLSGWIKTEFMDNPTGAVEDFTTMYKGVKFPVSKARAAYWLGRAHEKAGNTNESASWYKKAAVFQTTFYGQLAALKSGITTLDLPDEPSISSDKKAAFNKDDVTQAIKICIDQKSFDFANHLISTMIENSDDESDIALLAELGSKEGYDYLSVAAAKKALQQNVLLINAGYPTPKTPDSNPIERALTLAIIRQESEFNPRAKSSANAMGMMQLLLGTAKEVAQKNDIRFSKDRLWEPDYNIKLGSLYLSRLIRSYDGSYIMAIAAYNAGPGNVRKWTHAFGTPGDNIEDAINWIEKIPFKETRNYVQRVLENLQVFRYVDASKDSPALKLAEDLVK
jgi:soluble lytic murein transglycosylase